MRVSTLPPHTAPSLRSPSTPFASTGPHTPISNIMMNTLESSVGELIVPTSGGQVTFGFQEKEKMKEADEGEGEGRSLNQVTASNPDDATKSWSASANPTVCLGVSGPTLSSTLLKFGMGTRELVPGVTQVSPSGLPVPGAVRLAYTNTSQATSPAPQTLASSLGCLPNSTSRPKTPNRGSPRPYNTLAPTFCPPSCEPSEISLSPERLNASIAGLFPPQINLLLPQPKQPAYGSRSLEQQGLNPTTLKAIGQVPSNTSVFPQLPVTLGAVGKDESSTDRTGSAPTRRGSHSPRKVSPGKKGSPNRKANVTGVRRMPGNQTAPMLKLHPVPLSGGERAGICEPVSRNTSLVKTSGGVGLQSAELSPSLQLLPLHKARIVNPMSDGVSTHQFYFPAATGFDPGFLPPPVATSKSVEPLQGTASASKMDETEQPSRSQMPDTLHLLVDDNITKNMEQSAVDISLVTPVESKTTAVKRVEAGAHTVLAPEEVQKQLILDNLECPAALQNLEGPHTSSLLEVTEADIAMERTIITELQPPLPNPAEVVVTDTHKVQSENIDYATDKCKILDNVQLTANNNLSVSQSVDTDCSTSNSLSSQVLFPSSPKGLITIPGSQLQEQPYKKTDIETSVAATAIMPITDHSPKFVSHPGTSASQSGNDASQFGNNANQSGDNASQLGDNTAHPNINASPPDINTGQPGNNTGQVGNNANQPDINAGQPGINAGQPGINASQPDINDGQPGINAGQPGINASQPGINDGQPGINAGQPSIIAGQTNTFPTQSDTVTVFTTQPDKFSTPLDMLTTHPVSVTQTTTQGSPCFLHNMPSIPPLPTLDTKQSISTTQSLSPNYLVTLSHPFDIHSKTQNESIPATLTATQQISQSSNVVSQHISQRTHHQESIPEPFGSIPSTTEKGAGQVYAIDQLPMSSVTTMVESEALQDNDSMDRPLPTAPADKAGSSNKQETGASECVGGESHTVKTKEEVMVIAS
uniref:Uncharacterized protein n=1 Tax=Eptatretus burgeri TaxID=7764 RepID=A0A8C4WXF5_EPTBU